MLLSKLLQMTYRILPNKGAGRASKVRSDFMRFSIETYHHAKNEDPRSNGCGRRGCDSRKDGQTDSKTIYMDTAICSTLFTHNDWTNASVVSVVYECNSCEQSLYSTAYGQA